MNRILEYDLTNKDLINFKKCEKYQSCHLFVGSEGQLLLGLDDKTHLKFVVSDKARLVAVSSASLDMKLYKT